MESKDTLGHGVDLLRMRTTDSCEDLDAQIEVCIFHSWMQNCYSFYFAQARLKRVKLLQMELQSEATDTVEPSATPAPGLVLREFNTTNVLIICS